MIVTMPALGDAVLSLWHLAPLRIAGRLANAGLNLVTLRELVCALLGAELLSALLAVAWLVPWGRVGLAAWRHVHSGSRARRVPASGRMRGSRRPHLLRAL